ncbi:MAG: nitrate reductase [Wenzhouxiangella sp.]
MTILEFARGPMLHFALAVFVLGVIWRIVTILLLGFKRYRSEPRNGLVKSLIGGMMVTGSRSWPHKEFIGRTGAGEAIGYGYHIGLFIIVLVGTPHVVFWKNLFGVSASWWPTLPGGVIHVLSILTVTLLLIVLIRRLSHPVLRRLSNFDDYFSWFITFSVMVTGVMAVFGLGGRYETILAWHIISFNVLLIWFPFGKLMHAFFIFPTRAVVGYRQSRKGAAT